MLAFSASQEEPSQSNPDPQRDVFLVNADGGGLVNLTSNPPDDESPMWVSCDSMSPGCEARVAGIGAGQLNVRAVPGIDEEIEGTLEEGDSVCLLSWPRLAGGYKWWPIHTASGVDGWVAEYDPKNAGEAWLTATGAPCGAQSNAEPTSAPVRCPLNDPDVCAFISRLDDVLKSGDMDAFLSFFSFEEQTCVEPTDPLAISAADGARLSACYESIPGFPDACPRDRRAAVPDKCRLETTLVDMTSCGNTNWNLRYLTREQLLTHVFPGAQVTGVFTHAYGGEALSTFVVVHTKPSPIPGEYGWKDMPEDWALQIDQSTWKLTPHTFVSQPECWFGVVTPLPWP
ncbi:SH3 domain-containing protein [Candidatus Bathyarchaeota archaeon]|nr:SH3 domain-containing protein [Candidatus Bathyarchaeota archaeon]